MLASWLLLQLVGCAESDSSPPLVAVSKTTREARDLGPADTVGAADFDGDGVDETVLVQGGIARWRQHTLELGGEVHVVRRGDPDGDGRESLFLGTGMGRLSRTAPTRVWALGKSGPELIFQRTVERNQVADLDFLGERIWLAVFGSGTAVEAGWLVDGDLQAVETRKLATAWLPLSDDRRLIGRIYGDAPKAPGDLRLVGPDGERTLPTLRGVRALTAADLDGDGRDELLVGDGWHYAYGKQAVGRVRLLDGPNWETGRTIAMFDGEYTAWTLEVIGDRILATGTKAVHLLSRDGLGWADDNLAPIAETGNAVAYRDASGWWVLVSGKPARLVPLD